MKKHYFERFIFVDVTQVLPTKLEEAAIIVPKDGPTTTHQSKANVEDSQTENLKSVPVWNVFC